MTQDLLLEDAIDAARILVQMGRAPHPSKWVDDLIWANRKAELEGLI